jgi:hypothetical protein
MKRIALGLVATVAGVVLLLSYRTSVSEFLCDPQQVGHSAGVAVPDGDGGGVYVAVEAVAEDG